MENTIVNGDEKTDEIQQEIITEIINGNETVIAVYEVDESKTFGQGDDNADLSDLATVAEIVPSLQEDNSLRNEGNKGGIENVDLSVISDGSNRIRIGDDGIDEYEDEDEDDLDISITPGEYFVAASYDEMMTIIQDYFDRTTSRFVVQKRTKEFGVADTNFNLSKHRIQWEDSKNPNLAFDYNFLPFDGIPHITVGHYVMHCQFGNDASAAQKEKRRQLRENNEAPKRTRTLKHPTKKCGCPAKIYVKQVIKFPEYKIMKKTERRKRTGAAKLKEQFNSDRSSIKTEMYYMGRLPIVAEHQFHERMEGREFSKESVHKDLIIKAQELYFNKISLNEIAATLDSYVFNEMFFNQKPPDKKRRKYFPSRKDLRNFIGRIRQLEKFTKEERLKMSQIISDIRNEQKNFHILFLLTEEAKTMDPMLQMDYSDEELLNSEENNLDGTTNTIESQKIHLTKRQENQTFLFCYQTPEQQRLLKRYGTIAFLVEIHHNSSVKRALTFKMFVVMVQTNVDYQVVGCIAFSKQKKDGLKESLVAFKSWNEGWIPKYFLIDCTEEIARAYSEVFPNVPYFLNIHSCEKQWLEFLLKPSNELQDSEEEIMDFLQNMAYSFSENSLSSAASFLEDSAVWLKSVKLRTWFQSDWLPSAKKWVAGYRPEDLFIFDHLKYDLPSCIKIYQDILSDSTKVCIGFVGMIETLHHVVAPGEYAKYAERNNSQFQLSKQSKPNDALVDSLAGIPLFILPQLHSKCQEASECHFAIAEDNQLGLFVVSTLVVQKLDENDQVVLTDERKQQQVISDTNTSSLENCLLQALVAAENTTVQCTHLNLSQSNSSIPAEAGIEKFAPNSLSGSLLNTIDNQQRVDNVQPLEKESIIDTEEYSVSFGDSNSYPFCTCSYWQQYKLPCLHMFNIFQNIPGWSYDMLSPIYRMNSVFSVDCSCISQQPQTKQQMFNDKACQVNKTVVEVQTQKNIGGSIFVPMNSLHHNEELSKQVSDFLFQLNKSSFLFKDIILYKKLRSQLTDIIKSLRERLIEKEDQNQLDDGTTCSKITNNPLLLPISLDVAPTTLTGKKQKRPIKVKVAISPKPQPQSLPTALEIANVDEVNKLLKALIEANAQMQGQTILEPDMSDGGDGGCFKADNSSTMEVLNKAVNDVETLMNGVGHNENVLQGINVQNQSMDTELPKQTKTATNDVTEPILQVGVKRDGSHLQIDNSHNKSKHDNNKVSILEYLPLLKQKCVKPEDEKIRDAILTGKFNSTLEMELSKKQVVSADTEDETGFSTNKNSEIV